MYAIFDIALNCDIPLPELSEIETADVVINVKAGEDKESIPHQPVWFHHWKEPDGSISISCARQGSSYLLRFPQLVDFIISRSGESIQYFPEQGVAPETIRHLLLDQAIPRVLGQLGRLVMHASSVVMPGGQTIAFLGSSGRGKSTLASSFHQNGAELITDDCLLLDEEDGEIVGIPNYYGVRLFDDSAVAIFGNKLSFSPVAHYSTKNRLHLPVQAGLTRKTKSSHLSLFLLKDSLQGNCSNDVIIMPARGADELISLIEQTFILDVTDESLIINKFQNMGELISSNVKIYSLQYPRKHEYLSVVRSKIKGIL